VSEGLRHLLTRTCLKGSQVLTRCMLGGKSGPRDFSRVVVVAALARNNGVTSGARLQWAALRQLGIETELLDATPALRNPLFRIPHRPASAYVFHSGGPETAALIRAVCPAAGRAWRIGYWAWELPDPSPDWSGCDRNVDEVWTPSAFARDSLARLVSRPIAVVPHHVPARPARRRSAHQPFTVLTMADSRSSLSRKNPEGALRAFHAAFGASLSARMILKLGGGAEKWRVLEQSAGGILSGGNIEIVRGHLDEAALTALYRQADVLLSLHRAEGFGLPMREAMAHGLPVVGTGWSATPEFMSGAEGCLVPYRLVPVSDVSAIYRASIWAEPDIDAAARALRRLAEDAGHYAQLAAAAHRRASAARPRFPFVLPDRARAAELVPA
jgi:glycosyltransferase involved in cell wall biosynthesis